MTPYRFIKAEAAEFKDLKQKYLQQIAAPLDGMWETFVTLADHYFIGSGDKVIGYCAINAEQKLLQFYAGESHDEARIFNQVISELKVTGAFLSTGEFQYLSLCMDHQKSVQVNAFMYHVEKKAIIKDAAFPPETQFRLIEASELGAAVDFGIETLGADPDWLKAYLSDRIKRGELFGLWQDKALIATGECRVSDTQIPYADLGMMVSEKHRKQGLATSILRHLLHLCRDRGLKAICSTERENMAAQKAITKSGFTSNHRILEITF